MGGKNPLSGGGGSTSRILSTQFQADAERVRLRFIDVVTVVPGTGGQLYVQSYGVNTPRVPERTGSTGVAQGFGQYALRFARYCCLGSRISWRVTHLGDDASNSATAVRAVVAPVTSAGGSITSYSDAAVQKYSRRWAYPTQTGQASAAASPSTDPRNMWSGRHAMTVSKLEGQPMLRTSAYEALVSADPTNICTWRFTWADVNPNTSAASKPMLLFEVELEYDCVFFDRLQYPNTLEERAYPRTVVAGPSASRDVLRPRSAESDQTSPVSSPGEEKKVERPVGDRVIKPPSPPETVDRYALATPDAKVTQGPLSRSASLAGYVLVRQ